MIENILVSIYLLNTANWLSTESRTTTFKELFAASCGLLLTLWCWGFDFVDFVDFVVYGSVYSLFLFSDILVASDIFSFFCGVGGF